VDKEIADKHYRVVGMLQALEALAKDCYCMPSDATTASLLSSVRHLIRDTVTSAWKYAEERTAEGKGADHG
jgi:hypothetical protein